MMCKYGTVGTLVQVPGTSSTVKIEQEVFLVRARQSRIIVTSLTNSTERSKRGDRGL
jgi:hypothetical protein